MLEFDTIKLEDNNNYIILATLDNNTNKYVYLSEENNEDNFCIRKEITEDGKTYFIGLENEEEYNLALKLFNDKMSN